MTLANLAWVLASNGTRVLVVDMHLDAPGLHRYFAPFLTDPDLTQSSGVIEYLTEYTQAAAAISANVGTVPAAWLREHANILRHAVSLEWEFPSGGTVDFVPAGRQGTAYQVLVNDLSWDVLYDRLGGTAFVDETARRMREEYDYVLIDSPPGIGTLSGTCTLQLPDALVVCFVLNRQSILGGAEVTRSVRSQVRRPIEVFPVAMRVDLSEKELVDLTRTFAHREFEPLIDPALAGRDYWSSVEMPYIPYYSYTEVLAPFVDTGRHVQSMLASVERLAQHATHGAVSRATLPSQDERIRILTAFQTGVGLGSPPLR
jgi:hypothetical protein